MKLLPSLLYTLLVVGLISAISLIGVLALSIREATLDQLLFFLVSFASGAILGAAFFDLLPEAIKLGEEFGWGSQTIGYIVLGFVVFYLLERFIYFFHGDPHQQHCPPPEETSGVEGFALLNLIGDGAHNFLDGLLIAVAFGIDVALGIAASIAVIFHELPQEIGDFAVLVYGGFERTRALALNFLSALTAFGGALFAYFYTERVPAFNPFLIALTCGGFIYIAATELIPQVQKEHNIKRAALQFFLFILGLFLVWSLGLIFPELEGS
jgi:zinc and cadmium transporter